MERGGLVNIVKRGGARASESFRRDKLHNSIVAACIGAGAPTGQAEMIAKNVTEAVMGWLATKPEVTSHDVRRVAAKRLHTHHPDAAYLYEHHRTIL